MKSIIIKETEKEIIGFCPCCGERIFTENKTQAFAGVFTHCIKCEVNLEPYPNQENKEKEV